ncbi:2-amino-4-hydroxy-6-hydroxymethyldihydropteridinediphosphokinase [Gammaproteobacteria bacterium]
MPRAWISLGSNIRPEESLRAALKTLATHCGELTLSPVYRSPAVGFAGEDFLNLVAGVVTEHPPESLRTLFRQIEDAQGRIRTCEKFSARCLDIDLLTYGDRIDPSTNLPRDEILRYAFVLQPLAVVAGYEKHPALGQTYASLWRTLQKQGQVPLEAVPFAME